MPPVGPGGWEHGELPLAVHWAAALRGASRRPVSITPVTDMAANPPRPAAWHMRLGHGAQALYPPHHASHRAMPRMSSSSTRAGSWAGWSPPSQREASGPDPRGPRGALTTPRQLAAGTTAPQSTARRYPAHREPVRTGPAACRPPPTPGSPHHTTVRPITTTYRPGPHHTASLLRQTGPGELRTALKFPAAPCRRPTAQDMAHAPRGCPLGAPPPGRARPPHVIHMASPPDHGHVSQVPVGDREPRAQPLVTDHRSSAVFRPPRRRRPPS